ncbi:MAG: hypothetical protein K2H75_05070 [Muribaculaceae bacterium]|nr:hypothetical protein [Muribaculaceae bacterium]
MKFSYLTAALCMLALVSCSNHDEPEDIGGAQIKDVHFDVWVTAGTSNGTAYLVKNVNSLEEPQVISFENSGCDITGKLDQEIISKGQYYYEIPPTGDCFGKYQITNQGLVTVARRPFEKNVYRAYRYCHAWIDDHTLVIMSSDGDKTKALWTKLDTNNMTIIDEGEYNLTEMSGINALTTSGLLGYRKSDNKLIYFYARSAFAFEGFYAAFIDASTMEISTIAHENKEVIMAGTAYGELLQNKMAFDNNDNLYIACNYHLDGFSSTTQQYGRIFRINRNETEFDPGYEGFRTDPSGTPDRGKILTIDYMGQNKLVLCIQDPEHCGVVIDPDDKNQGWGNNYNVYYCMLDIPSDVATEFKYEGKNLPYSQGTFAQRSFVLNGKVYIGTNPKEEIPTIYVYDIRSTKMVKGAQIQEGFGFDRITYVADR